MRRFVWSKDTSPVLYAELWKVTNLIEGDRLEVYRYKGNGGWSISRGTLEGGCTFGHNIRTLEAAKRTARRSYLDAYTRIMKRAREVLE